MQNPDLASFSLIPQKCEFHYLRLATPKHPKTPTNQPPAVQQPNMVNFKPHYNYPGSWWVGDWAKLSLAEQANWNWA